MNNPEGTNALDLADAVLEEKGRSFHWARHLLGKKHAARATRLYAFCRHLDDLADEAGSKERARASLDAAGRDIATGSSSDPVIRNGLSLMTECGIGNALVLELISGALSDLDEVRMRDEAGLLRYCYQVAGTVGLMMCRVLDVDDPRAFLHAIDLGIAMQLTNICRDVAADAAMGRRYLPATLIGDLQAVDLVDPAFDRRDTIREGILSLLTLADDYYRSGEAGLSYLPLQARAGILVASRVYHGIGEELRSRGGDCWSRRTEVSSLRKALLSTVALAGTAHNKSFWITGSAHKRALHSCLTGLPGINLP
ncbi:MAG: phytoene/squalene synthase family protein [Verrucomicrobia bacterium]|nr:phytoene/squalene synthase family protein [Verrucomicrobiota bacterium]